MSNDETPKTPETPETPETPVSPEGRETGKTPETPETPEIREAPKTPGSRAAPGGAPRPPEPQKPAQRPDAEGPGPKEQPEPPKPDAPKSPEPEDGTRQEGPEPEEEPEGPADAPLTGRGRLAAGLWPPRVTRAQLIVALLLFVLGLGLAIQVRSTSDNSALRGARQEDLVRILDELDDRTQRLEDEKRRLENQRTELENSSDQAEEARKQTVQKEQQLGILAGTVPAQGPGINVTVSDAKRAVQADMLLDAIQELRAAGAEAIQINGVRVVADTYFSDVAAGVRVDGKRIAQPYRFKVIGKPQDLEPALNIPGGVVQTLEKEQATVAVARAQKIVVNALRPVKQPDYARSSSQ
ncbi:DUF881 domain-containing protein [Streptomyces sp. 8N706]|uniref:DUF881 domain-containing protein n=1 Tax=Streptomyces sp. 8N706 TaxID=3457416 RepID=UPI003FCF093B